MIATPPEKIVETDLAATVSARGQLGDAMTRRIVLLACGHRAVARNLTKMVCPRCTEMLRRSMETGDVDYVGFRNGRREDDMEWPEDRCRAANEKAYALAVLRKMTPRKKGEVQ
ncbi:MAG: hypothetical protein IBJ15_00225 [Alphaproteobacteria bacterium]|nr:hypothetical protein [Alphaproteobacteria bacterium]